MRNQLDITREEDECSQYTNTPLYIYMYNSMQNIIMVNKTLHT